MRFLPAILTAALLWGSARVEAQTLRQQPTPFSVWLDFDALSASNPARPPLPIWLESVQAEKVAAQGTGEEQTVFRIRLRHMGELNRELQLRVFFDDLPGVSPVVTGWTETGTQRWTSGPLGSGLGLASSESLILPAAQLDYLDVTVPGKGRTVRGVFLSSVKLTETRFALDFAAPPRFTEPFGSSSPAPAATDDTWLLGRVKAVLEAGPLKIAPLRPASWDFELDRVASLTVLNFEILNPDLDHPPEAALNGQALGVVSLQLPDLADPAYHGEVFADRHYRYNGWLRGQLILPVGALQAGVNELDLAVNPASTAVALRAVELQLKYPTP